MTYHGAPRFGMEFVPERSQVYTAFSTSQWLVCVDDPGDRATLKLSVVLPAGATVADLRRGLAVECPSLGGLLARSAIALNDDFANDATVIPENAEAALLPPVSGG